MPRVLSETDLTDFRERLCEVATRLFAEKGPQGVTMRELASALGVSAMTPYRYFRDKDAILAAVRARAFDRFSDALEKAYAGPGTTPERAHAKREAYVRFALEEPAAYRLMFDMSQAGNEEYPDLLRATARAQAQMTEHVYALVEEGMLSGDPELIGHVFWAALHGAVTLHLAGKLSPQYKLTQQYGIDRIITETMRALGEGFRARE
ncbi:MAG: TetR/AcrR family transcriptional regulator [Alphaproteobacteria bacterium]|nr:TetR/AcrR family transcriptional regulator [Alphaproteobacteria bacterium]MDE2163711.1 TetR/AcrR family transcriptional regulator [Alphaproteobacteria bacterium]MDE2265974.1 TetR/AcrR family transcriptional regulator [Alphaproteobacteria bacterium]MDE2500302.1 TetR/AcrR family transcriptional regulator [Alphaproteobacteria bacterium]